VVQPPIVNMAAIAAAPSILRIEVPLKRMSEKGQ
jgi:hypothetical protein